MARKKSDTLTQAELRLMNVLWDQGEATVGEVAEALPEDQAVAYNSVLTVLRILEQKGYVRHSKRGRAYLYRPLVDRGEARQSAVKQLVGRFFSGSPELMVLHLLEHEEVTSDQLSQLKKMLEEQA